MLWKFKNGVFIGVLKAVWNVKEIVHILGNSLLSEGNEGYSKMNYKLLNKDGMIVYSSKIFDFLEDDSDLLFNIYEHSVKKVIIS